MLDLGLCILLGNLVVRILMLIKSGVIDLEKYDFFRNFEIDF